MYLRRGLAVLMLLASVSCGGDDTAAPSPTPTGTHEITGRIMGPAGDAQDTVDQLEDIQDNYGN